MAKTIGDAHIPFFKYLIQVQLHIWVHFPVQAYPWKQQVMAWMVGSLSSHREEDWVPSSWICPDPLLVVAGIWGMSYQTEDFSCSLTIFISLPFKTHLINWLKIYFKKEISHQVSLLLILTLRINNHQCSHAWCSLLASLIHIEQSQYHSLCNP